MDRINGADTIDIGGGRRGFIDEDIDVGQVGTEVTALWLNMVQEELLKIVEATGQGPSEVDWSQLGNAIRSGKLNFAVAGGTANALTIALPLAPASYDDIRSITVVPSSANSSGGVTINVNGLGNIPLQARGGSLLRGGALQPGVPALINIFNGVGYLAGSLGTLIGRQVFATPGSFTYTPSPGTAFVIVEGCGGGGAGGGSPITGAGFSSAAAGGACGAFGSKLINGPIASQIVVVGPGGTGVAGATGGNGGSSSFGSFMTLPGGPGGTAGATYNTPSSSGASFKGSEPTGADYGSAGSGAYAGFAFAGAAISGAGGSSPYGLGGVATGVNGTSAIPGSFGSGFGAGGGGAVAVNSGVANPGGSGRGGIIIIHEYAGN